MGCSSSKSSDVAGSIRRKVALPAKRGLHGKKVHQNADVHHPALCPELNFLLCKLKQETPMMFKGSYGGAATLREIMNKPEEENEDPRSLRRRTMSASVIHSLEDLDATEASEKAPICEEDRSRDLAGDCFEITGESRAPVFDPETCGAAAEAASGNERPSDSTVAAEKLEAEEDLLESFDSRCPPNGGEHKAVLYTTSLRGIRKTYEDCQRAKVIVEGYGVSLDERDVAMHSDFLRELKSLTERGAVVPQLFVRGKYVGGAEDVVELHDEGKLGGLLAGLPRGGKSCEGCGGLHFLPCVKCSGSRRVVDAEGGFEASRCLDCNENGLIRCPLCSFSSSPSEPV